eukprot:c8732_g1_i1.p1 GENE.c8732_g1_i1~~c8732_g1_i1.p1  ORF type:complete len:152 (-),score=38.19 c8732_g1_i1:177-584(-)
MAEISDEVKQRFKALWKRSGDGEAMLLKIDKASHSVVLDQAFDTITLSDLADELTETNPRYIVYSYKWQRGERIQFPISLIYYKPSNTNSEQRMLYTRLVIDLQKQFAVNKVFEIEDSDDLTTDWLVSNLTKAHF